jgi:hypothetical protein
MRRRTLAAVTVVVTLVLSGIALAATRDPHSERLRLRATDVARAKQAVLQPKDLASGWKGGAIRSTDGDSKCPGWDPDFSAYTITGRANSHFTRYGADVFAHVEVYPTRAQASGDFRLGARPPVAHCLAAAIVSGLRAGVGSGVTVKLATARTVSPPRLGERAFSTRIVAIASGTRTIKVYSDVLAFQQGRFIGLVMFTGTGSHVRGQLPLGRLMLGRMR